MQTITNKPVHEVRLASVKAAIWKNQSATGFHYSATFVRLYRDKGQQEWKSTPSFGRDDLLLLAKVADRVHDWIVSQTHENSAHALN